MVLDQGTIEFDGRPSEAIRRYLKPTINTATHRVVFVNKDNLINQVLSFHCGQPLTLNFEVESFVEENFSLGVAIEIPRLSIIAMLSNDNLISGGKGRYEITVEFAVFPVSYRECYLSLFLSKPRSDKKGPTEEIYDQISWTTGESILMKNAKPIGYEGESIFHRSFSWKRCK
jgi:hypothetical protein